MGITVNQTIGGVEQEVGEMLSQKMKEVKFKKINSKEAGNSTRER